MEAFKPLDGADRQGAASSIGAVPGQVSNARLILSIVLFAAVWAVAHPYGGIDGDAILYVGRGLASARPTSVGRDLMFTADGQFGFSAFTPLVEWAVGRFGEGHASLAIATAGQGAMVAAYVVLALRLPQGRSAMLLPILAAVAVLPDAYGPFQRFHVAEFAAIPRPFAEALVLGALAALLARSDKAALALLCAAAVVHPIMAAPGFGAAFLVKVAEDRRWIAAVPVALVLAVGLSLAGVPILARLSTTMDPAWLSIVEARNPLLFLRDWRLDDVAAASVQALTVLVAAWLATGRLRNVALACLGAALVGTAISLVFGDGVGVPLVVQAQPWRGFWLVSALAALGLVPCCLCLWSRGAAHRWVAALLVLDWCLVDLPAAALAAVAATLVALALARRRVPLPDRVIRLGLVLVAVVLVAFLVFEASAYLAVRQAGALDPVAGGFGARHLSAVRFVIVAAVLGIALRGSRTILPLGIATVAALAAATVFWDDRSAAQRDLEEQGPPDDLVAILATRPGQVLWIDGIAEPMLWLHRASWYSALQGTGTVFSRPLAMEWQARKRVLVGAGLLPAGDRGLPGEVRSRPLPAIDDAEVRRVCAEASGLAWLVLPVLAGGDDANIHDAPLHDAPLHGGIAWSPRRPVYKPELVGGSVRWRRVDHYDVVACPGPIGDR